MSDRPELDKQILEDFRRIVQHSPMLLTAYDNLPKNQRETVDDRFLELMWQMVLAHAEPMLEAGTYAAGKTFKQFGAFIMQCNTGKHVEFHGPGWVAMDRTTYENLKEAGGA